MKIALGLMSGTSLDGVDAALIETDGERVGRHIGALTLPYPPDLRDRLRGLLDRAAAIARDDLGLLEAIRALTLHHIDAVRLLRARFPDVPVDVVGFHGQTLLHAPERGVTWQAGDAALLARETGLPVVFDFRSADVAAGGQGAPLVPFYHAALLGDRPGPMAVLNTGGVANVTLIGAAGAIWACDTGPGNALLDDWVHRMTGMACDVDGALARSGTVHREIVESLLSDPFFSSPPPKSLDRLAFVRALESVAVLSPEDGAATLSAFTVEGVARTPLPERPRAWYVCGGGRHNPVLMEGLAVRLSVPVAPVESLGWDGDALEAECFGFLAVRSLFGLPLSCPGTTGVPRPLSGGWVCRPSPEAFA
jgi:anhydro-N-acetylmuramic acid kinase